MIFFLLSNLIFFYKNKYFTKMDELKYLNFLKYSWKY